MSCWRSIFEGGCTYKETLRSREHVACVMLKGGLAAACSWSGENAARVRG
jgi:hypothetical protein